MNRQVAGPSPSEIVRGMVRQLDLAMHGESAYSREFSSRKPPEAVWWDLLNEVRGAMRGIEP